MAASGISISIDSGSTFTDIYASIPGKSQDITLKLPSVDPQKYHDAPTEGIRRVLEIASGSQIPCGRPLNLSEVKSIRMGTTVAANALSEGKGERSALVITKGFRDLLLLGDQAPLDLFGFTVPKPMALYEKVLEVDERVILEPSPDDPGGQAANVDPDKVLDTGVSQQVIRIVREPYWGIVEQHFVEMHDRGIRSVSICLMHSSVYPNHEFRLADLARKAGLNVTVSSLLNPKIGMVARAESATLHAYVTPVIRKHVEHLRNLFVGQMRDPTLPPCEFMQNDGTMAHIHDIVGSKGILSSSVGGLLGYASTCYDRSSGKPLIGFDMGGTSTKISRFAGEYERVTTTLAGNTIELPQLNINTIATGGSSQLYWSKGSAEVGPDSVGAHPGPACYQKGGPLTVTDANLLLGRLVPECFPKVCGPNGDKSLDIEVTRRMFNDLCSDINNGANSDATKLTPEQAALNFLRIAEKNMCRAILRQTETRGYEASGHDLVAFGGAAGQHACFIASSLGINRVILHHHSSMLSAYGMAFGSLVSDLEEPLECVFRRDTIPRIREIEASLRVRAESELRERGIGDADDIEFKVEILMHYEGSDTIIAISKPENELELTMKFADVHKKKYGFIAARPVVACTVRLRAVGLKKPPSDLSPAQQFACLGEFRAPSREARVMTKDVYFGERGWQRTPVYRLESLRTADRIEGPALIVDNTQTILVTPNAQATILRSHVVIDIASPTAHAVVQKIAIDPLQFAIFDYRFSSMMKKMKRMLRRTDISSEMKKHLKFSCGIFSANSRLIACAPFGPSHISTMKCAVQSNRGNWKHKLQDGDILVFRQPRLCGSTHPLDITVVTPVFHGGVIVFYCTSSGIFTDSSALISKEPWQEDGEIIPAEVVRDGAMDEESIEKYILSDRKQHSDCSDSSYLADNLANLRVLVDANQQVRERLMKLLEGQEMKVVSAYVRAMERRPETAVRQLLRIVHDKRGGRPLVATDLMSDGSPICLKITIDYDKGEADFDFTGTARTNFPAHVAQAAIMYLLHHWIKGEIRFSQGLLNPINIILPSQAGSTPNPQSDNTISNRRVASHHVLELMLQCFDIYSSGRLHNLMFSVRGQITPDGTYIPGFMHQETIVGGSCAGPDWHGKNAMEVGTTKTRIIDAELLERQYPCLVWEFSVRHGSGGRGQFYGGDGCNRVIEFLKPVSLTVMSECQPPSSDGFHGGCHGEAGVNLLIKKATSDREPNQVVNLGPKSTTNKAESIRSLSQAIYRLGDRKFSPAKLRVHLLRMQVDFATQIYTVNLADTQAGSMRIVSIDEDSLHGLQCAVEELDYSRQSHQSQNQHLHQQTHLQSLVKRPDQHVDIRTILDPPDLDAWRERLFNVDEMIVLSEEQFLTYFPHIDNVYSHRSTQHYKRKPLISHYWDCRLKGRPPGTPKSNDPNKKKRKRTARQRDLCDVKIKITEYFPGHDVMGSDLGVLDGLGVPSPVLQESAVREQQQAQNQQFGLLTPSLNPPLPEGHPGVNGQRFFTIQRVNGNGANGKNDGVSGGHRHTLEDSDRVKKNSVQRFLLQELKEKKRSLNTRVMATQNQIQKQYHTKATGLAAQTVAHRSQDNELKLYGSCFCPFVQRVWVALEIKGIPYQYIEVDPHKKPQSLLDVNPRGLVPALRHGDWGSYESSVLLEYLEDLNVGTPLLPPGDAKLRAHCRLWTDFINRHIVPNFYRVLQEQDTHKQITNAQELRDAFNTLVGAADAQGPFFLGAQISFVDVQVAPWIIRLRRALKPYRGWPDPEPGSRWGAWVDAIENNEHIQATTSTDELYLDSYERYAQNRPNTSQVANAINSGRGLP
ncbi:hypothetical protein CBS147343_4606 [Aspergillus niger]|nr:hypothetical protein CBS147482_389 [Aspergillus niger]KAI3074767.1 hypothetical protein CBS147343_4606 [Aspergillus niger]